MPGYKKKVLRHHLFWMMAQHLFIVRLATHISKWKQWKKPKTKVAEGLTDVTLIFADSDIVVKSDFGNPVRVFQSLFPII